MSEPTNTAPTPEAQAILDCLRQTVAKTLERKRRLGQYVVLWDGKQPVLEGEDAPAHSRPVDS